jgi:hypothetical protein
MSFIILITVINGFSIDTCTNILSSTDKVSVWHPRDNCLILQLDDRKQAAFIEFLWLNFLFSCKMAISN